MIRAGSSVLLRAVGCPEVSFVVGGGENVAMNHLFDHFRGSMSCSRGDRIDLCA